MKQAMLETWFGRDRAETYDQMQDRMAPLRDAAMLFLGLTLDELPPDARVLCVGVGTGTELIRLAEAHPGWTFTAVEPASAMMDVCRRKIAAAELEDRCDFHGGFLDSLADKGPYDGATCLLVSHFLMTTSERRGLFEEIAARLKPGGLLISADLAADLDSPAYRALRGPWFSMLTPPGAPEVDLKTASAAHGRDVSLLHPRIVEEIIASAGFEEPVPIYQFLLIHGWMARRSE